MINCAIYPRKSKAMDNSDSMDAQVDMCIRYLNENIGENNYKVKIYDGDYGITGHSIKLRKDFQRMMQDVSDKKIQLVLIQRYDRIARNTRDFCNLYHEMEINGCNLVSVSQQIDTSTPYGKNFMYMQASMAELEWALSSERRKDANKYARSVGKCTLSDHSIPFGYKAERIDGIRKMVKDSDKECIVIEIFDYFMMYSNYCGTAKMVNEKYGLSMSNQSIKKMIKNTIYYGKYRENETYCDPYITRDYWEELQRKKPVIRSDMRKKSDSLFRGLVRCPSCGRLMRSNNQKKKSGNSYRSLFCEYHSYNQCEFRRMKSELLMEQMLVNYIISFLEGKSIAIKEEMHRNNPSDKIKPLKAELERLNTMYLKGRITEEVYDNEYEKLSNRIAVLEESGKENTSNNRAIEYFSSDWQEAYNLLDTTHRRLFWKSIVKQIIVNEEMRIIDVIFL